MAEFDLDKMADQVAEKALDEFTYKDKTLREWVEIIVTQDLLAIAVLEKIKTEMLDEYRTNANIDNVTHCRYLKIITNHIDKLKGENK